MGTQLPLPQRHRPSVFGPYVLWPIAGWIKVPLGMETGLGFVLYDPASPPQKGAEPPPQFSTHVYCGQMAGWIKMALGMEVGLGPGHTVLDGTQLLSPKKRAEPPIFGPSLLWPNGCMHQDATWYGAWPHPRRLCVRSGPRPHSPKEAQPPAFGSFIVAKRLDG